MTSMATDCNRFTIPAFLLPSDRAAAFAAIPAAKLQQVLVTECRRGAAISVTWLAAPTICAHRTGPYCADGEYSLGMVGSCPKHRAGTCARNPDAIVRQFEQSPKHQAACGIRRLDG